MRSSWMFIWGLGLGKSVSPHVSLSFPGLEEKTTAHVALTALQPLPMLPQLRQEAQSSISSDGSFRERGLLLGTSNLSAPYCLVVTEISLDSQRQKSFGVSPLAVLEHICSVCAGKASLGIPSEIGFPWKHQGLQEGSELRRTGPDLCHPTLSLPQEVFHAKLQCAARAAQLSDRAVGHAAIAQKCFFSRTDKILCSPP